MNRAVFTFGGGGIKQYPILVCQHAVGCTEAQPRRLAQCLTRGQECDEVVSGRSGVNDDIGGVHADPVIEMIVFNVLDLFDDVIAFIGQLLSNGYRFRLLCGAR